MRITRRQLRRIVETFAATAEEEALKVNKEAGISLVTDQAFWDERGISTGEELAKHLLASTYSDYYKDLHGIRPRWMADKIKTMSVEEIQTLIDDLDKEAEVMAADEKWEEENLPGWEDEMMAAVEANPEDIPSEYLEYENLPQQSEMGRRAEGIVRITERQLRKVIRESIILHEREILEEGIFQDAMGWIKKKGQGGMAKAKEFFEGLTKELVETDIGIRILKDIVSGKELPPDDAEFLKKQVKDLAKGSVLLGLFLLPGGGVASTALVKAAAKVGVELMPSSFAG